LGTALLRALVNLCGAGAISPVAAVCGTLARVRYDVVVVGAGPSGAAAAYWLAEQGRRVLVVEKKRFPREKTCGDGLTPRAVRQLEDMGLAEPLADFLRYDGRPMAMWCAAATSTRWLRDGR
jgi:choline dehydrogenase-like flavoprotein